MTDLERHIDHIAATGRFGQIPQFNGELSVPVRITKWEKKPDKTHVLQCVDKQGNELTITAKG